MEKRKGGFEADHSWLLFRFWFSLFKAESTSILPAYWYWEHMICYSSSKEARGCEMQCRTLMRIWKTELFSSWVLTELKWWMWVLALTFQELHTLPALLIQDGVKNLLRLIWPSGYCFMLIFFHVETCNSAGNNTEEMRHHASLGKGVKDPDLGGISVNSSGRG